MAKKIAFLEQIDEFTRFKAYLTGTSQNIDDFEIVILDYELGAYLNKFNIKYSNSLKYFNNESHKSILLKYDEIFNKIDTFFNFTDSYGATRIYKREIELYVELSFNYMAKILHILENIYLKNPDCEFYVDSNKYIGDSVFITDDRLIVCLAEEFTRVRKVKLNKWGQDVGNNSSDISVTKNTTNKKKSPFYSILFRIVQIYFNFFKKKIILLPAWGREFQPVINEIKKRHQDIIFLTIYSGKNNKNSIKKYIGLIYGFFSKHFRCDIDYLPASQTPIDFSTKIKSFFNSNPGIFEINRVNFDRIICQKTVLSLKRHLQNISFSSEKLSYIFENFNIKIILSFFGNGIWYLAPELAKKYDISSLFISHGTHPVPTNKYHEICQYSLCLSFMLGDYSHIALSTPIQEEHLHYYKKKYPHIKNEEIKTGPLIFANISKSDKLSSKKKFGFGKEDFVVLHAATIKFKGGERFYFIETIDEYLSALSDIIKIADEIEPLKLIIRLHPGFDYLEDNIRFYLPRSDKFIISKTGPFSELLSASDLLISYSSTCIDEALMNKIPVLLYDKWNRYNHFRTGIFDNEYSSNIFPVCYVNNENNLGKALNYIWQQIRCKTMDNTGISPYKYLEDYSENIYDLIANTISKDKG